MLDETKQKISESLTGRTLSEKHKLNIGKANRYVPTYEGKNAPNLKEGRNQGSKNPRAKRIIVGERTFECMKHAYEYYGVSKSTFKKHYKYQEI